MNPKCNYKNIGSKKVSSKRQPCKKKENEINSRTNKFNKNAKKFNKTNSMTCMKTIYNNIDIFGNDLYDQNQEVDYLNFSKMIIHHTKKNSLIDDDDIFSTNFIKKSVENLNESTPKSKCKIKNVKKNSETNSQTIIKNDNLKSTKTGNPKDDLDQSQSDNLLIISKSKGKLFDIKNEESNLNDDLTDNSLNTICNYYDKTERKNIEYNDSSILDKSKKKHKNYESKELQNSSAFMIKKNLINCFAEIDIPHIYNKPLAGKNSFKCASDRTDNTNLNKIKYLKYKNLKIEKEIQNKNINLDKLNEYIINDLNTKNDFNKKIVDMKDNKFNKKDSFLQQYLDINLIIGNKENKNDKIYKLPNKNKSEFLDTNLNENIDQTNDVKNVKDLQKITKRNKNLIPKYKNMLAVDTGERNKNKIQIKTTNNLNNNNTYGNKSKRKIMKLNSKSKINKTVEGNSLSKYNKDNSYQLRYKLANKCNTQRNYKEFKNNEVNEIKKKINIGLNNKLNSYKEQKNINININNNNNYNANIKQDLNYNKRNSLYNLEKHNSYLITPQHKKMTVKCLKKIKNNSLDVDQHGSNLISQEGDNKFFSFCSSTRVKRSKRICINKDKNVNSNLCKYSNYRIELNLDNNETNDIKIISNIQDNYKISNNNYKYNYSNKQQEKISSKISLKKNNQSASLLSTANTNKDLMISKSYKQLIITENNNQNLNFTGDKNTKISSINNESINDNLSITNNLNINNITLKHQSLKKNALKISKTLTENNIMNKFINTPTNTKHNKISKISKFSEVNQLKHLKHLKNLEQDKEQNGFSLIKKKNTFNTSQKKDGYLSSNLKVYIKKSNTKNSMNGNESNKQNNKTRNKLDIVQEKNVKEKLIYRMNKATKNLNSLLNENLNRTRGKINITDKANNCDVMENSKKSNEGIFKFFDVINNKENSEHTLNNNRRVNREIYIKKNSKSKIIKKL